MILFVAIVSMMAANGPTAFAMSLLPCEKAKPLAVSTCSQLNIKNADLFKFERRRVLAKINIKSQVISVDIPMMR